MNVIDDSFTPEEREEIEKKAALIAAKMTQAINGQALETLVYLSIIHHITGMLMLAIHVPPKHRDIIREYLKIRVEQAFNQAMDIQDRGLHTPEPAPPPH